MSIRIADGFMNFTCCTIFIFWFNFSRRYIAKHDLRCMQFTDSACKGNQKMTDILSQQLIKISIFLLQAAGRYQIAACNTFSFSLIISILQLVSTLWFFAERRQTTFTIKTKVIK
jgi:hypothetical protein